MRILAFILFITIIVGCDDVDSSVNKSEDKTQPLAKVVPVDILFSGPVPSEIGDNSSITEVTVRSFCWK